MTRFAVCLAIWDVLALPGPATDVRNSSALTPEATERIHVLADPYLMDVFLPEQPDEVKVPSSSVPERAKAHATVWISRVVREKWLPANIQGKFVGLKDLKLWEKRNEKGTVISKLVGDFLTLGYEVSGHGIHVHESGVSVSLRVDFSQPVPIGDDPAAFIRKCLLDFLNLSEEMVSQLQGDVKDESPVYFAYLRGPLVIKRELAIKELAQRVPSGQSFELDDQPEISELPRQWQWWDRIWVCTDGRFFFVNVVEAEPVTKERYNPRAKPGLPDRF